MLFLKDIIIMFDLCNMYNVNVNVCSQCFIVLDIS